MAKEISAQIQYKGEQGNIHSDLPTNNRALLHDALDEWLDKADGTGFFYIGETNSILQEVEDW
jgi:hypothetical protein